MAQIRGAGRGYHLFSTKYFDLISYIQLNASLGFPINPIKICN